MSQEPPAQGEIMPRLVSLLHSMNNISNKHELLGDFRCLHSSKSTIEHDITRNRMLKNILENILHSMDREDIDNNNKSTLELDFSRVFRSGRGEVASDVFRRIQTLAALKGFLRQKDDMDATKFHATGSLIRSLPMKLKMVKVDISRNDLVDQDVMDVCKACQGLPTLVELNMSYNQIGAEGANAIFSALLCHSSCKIQRLDLQWNWNLYNVDDGGAFQNMLVRVLQHRNKSLTELHLVGTPFESSFELARAFYDFSNESSAGIFGIPQNYNHHLRVLTIGCGSAESNKMLLSALTMNEDGPEEAMARKIDHCLDMNKLEIFGDNGDPDQVFRCLELLGKYGSNTTLFKTVQKFTANGSLFGGMR